MVRWNRDSVCVLTSVLLLIFPLCTIMQQVITGYLIDNQYLINTIQLHGNYVQ